MEKLLKVQTSLYIGTKIIRACPMTRGAYNDYRGWTVPKEENPLEMGYLVEYLDSPNSNHPDHDNYITWSPEEVFKKAYRKTKGLTFGLAIEAMKKGMKVTRVGWNGENMWLMLVREELAKSVSLQFEALKSAPWIGMKTVDDKFIPWLASQTDMLSEDWEILN